MNYRTVVDNDGKTCITTNGFSILSLLQYLTGFLKIIRTKVQEYTTQRIRVKKHT